MQHGGASLLHMAPLAALHYLRQHGARNKRVPGALTRSTPGTLGPGFFTVFFPRLPMMSVCLIGRKHPYRRGARPGQYVRYFRCETAQ